MLMPFRIMLKELKSFTILPSKCSQHTHFENSQKCKCRTAYRSEISSMKWEYFSPHAKFEILWGKMNMREQREPEQHRPQRVNSIWWLRCRWFLFQLWVCWAESVCACVRAQSEQAKWYTEWSFPAHLSHTIVNYIFEKKKPSEFYRSVSRFYVNPKMLNAL